RLAEERRLHQQVRAFLEIANLVVGQAFTHERGHVENGTQRHAGHAERHHRVGMAVDDRYHFWPRLEDFAMYEALAHGFAPARVHRVAVEIVFDDVLLGDVFRRDVPGEEIAVGIALGAHAHVTVRIDDIVLREYAVGRNEVEDLGHRHCSLRSAASCQPSAPSLNRKSPWLMAGSWRVVAGGWHQSALIFAAVTTRRQRASSLFTSAPSRSGGPPPAFKLCFASCSLTSGN